MTSTILPTLSNDWLPEGTELTVSLLNLPRSRRFTIKIEAQNVIPQIGKSYKVSASVPLLFADGTIGSSNEKKGIYFLKIPDPVAPDDREALEKRFQAEMQRGEELNEIISLISPVASSPHPEREDHKWEFRLPRFVQAGIIESIMMPPDTSAKTDVGRLPFVMYEWLPGTQMDTYIELSKGTGAINWFEFAYELATIIKRLHNHGFLHAHIVPRNILVDDASRTISLAGFGYSSLSIEKALKPSISIEADLPYQAPEFSGSRSLDALWFAADIFSVGAILFLLATGKAPQLRAKDDSLRFAFTDNVDKLKNYVRKELEEASKRGADSIGSNDNVAKIIDNCLRYSAEDRFETVEELIEAIEIAETKPAKHRITEHGEVVVGAFFCDLLEQKAAQFESVKERIEKRHHNELYGSRTNIIGGLCRMLGGLEEGTVYRTVTLPSYWTQNNLGPDGRFLAMNKHVARRGVVIQRVFLVGGPFYTLSDEEQEILRAQKRAMDSLQEDLRSNLEVKVFAPGNKTVVDFERSGQSVAFIAYPFRGAGTTSEHDVSEDMALQVDEMRAYGRYLSLNFISQGEEIQKYGKNIIERQINKVRIWDPGRGDVYWGRLKREAISFQSIWEQGRTLPLTEYMDERRSLTLRELLNKGK